MGLWRRIDVRNPSHQAFALLWIGFIAAPILFGLDKFFDWTVNWDKYLAPWINNIVPGTAHQFMVVAGVIEIVAGLMILLAPQIAGYVVAAWLGGIIVNLLTANAPQFYDIALRDLGLMLGALALARLATAVRASAVRTRTTNEPVLRQTQAA
jgi:hypothetical protein